MLLCLNKYFIMIWCLMKDKIYFGCKFWVKLKDIKIGKKIDGLYLWKFNIKILIYGY